MLFIRTEDITPDKVKSYYIEMDQDRKIIDSLKSQTPCVLVGGRGIGKSFLLRITEQELLEDFEDKRTLPVYITFRASPLISTKNENQFYYWMLSRISSEIIRQFRKKGLINNSTPSLKKFLGQEDSLSTTKIEQLCELFENSYKYPNQLIDTSDIPSIDDFINVLEDVCLDSNVERIVLLIDEAAHVFIPEQQRQFFTLIRDLRVSFITVNAAVYPGITVYGDTFQPTHDATFINLNRSINDEDYINNMKEMVFKQADSTLTNKLLNRGESFTILAYASGGNPRHLLKTIEKISNSKIDGNVVNEIIREYYRNDIWSEHSLLSEKYSGLSRVIDWARTFIEETVIPDLKKRNESALHKNDKTTSYLWIDRNAPQLVKEALRILEYTGIITEASKGIKATRGKIGNRYCLNVGCLFSADNAPSNTGLNIVNNLSIKKMLEYGMNSKKFEDVPDVDSFYDLSEVLNTLLSKPITHLDLTQWQKDKLHEVEIYTIGQVLEASEEKLMEAYYVAETRSRQMKNSAIAAVYEYLVG